MAIEILLQACFGSQRRSTSLRKPGSFDSERQEEHSERRRWLPLGPGHVQGPVPRARVSQGAPCASPKPCGWLAGGPLTGTLMLPAILAAKRN